MLKRLILITLPAIALAVITSCGGGGGSTSSTAAVSPVPVSSSIVLDVIGDSQSAPNILVGPSWPEQLQSYYNGVGANVTIRNLAVDGSSFSISNSSGAVNTNILLVGLGTLDGVFQPDPQVEVNATNLFKQIRTANPNAKVVFVEFEQTNSNPPVYGLASSLADLTIEIPMYKLRSAGLLLNDGQLFSGIDPTLQLPSIHPGVVANRFIMAWVAKGLQGIMPTNQAQQYGPWNDSDAALDPTSAAALAVIKGQ